MQWIRTLRVFGFATVYFFIYATSIIYFTIKSLPPTPEYSWYFQDPWTALRTIFGYALFELPRSPLLMLALFTLILQSLALGFVTDWAFRLLIRRLQLRTKKQEKLIN